MPHLTDDRLTALIFDAGEPSEIERQHLQSCVACRQALDDLRLLADDMAVLAQSEPGGDALRSYYQLFTQVQTQPAVGLGRRIREIVAALTWDSRQQSALAGVRTAADNAYRLLYAADQVEVELMVEPVGAERRLEGELMPLGVEPLTPALLQLQPLDPPASPVLEYEIAAREQSGRFHFSNLRPGRYRLTVVTPPDQVITVDRLDIT